MVSYIKFVSVVGFVYATPTNETTDCRLIKDSGCPKGKRSLGNLKDCRDPKEGSGSDELEVCSPDICCLEPPKTRCNPYSGDCKKCLANDCVVSGDECITACPSDAPNCYLNDVITDEDKKKSKEQRIKEQCTEYVKHKNFSEKNTPLCAKHTSCKACTKQKMTKNGNCMWFPSGDAPEEGTCGSEQTNPFQTKIVRTKKQCPTKKGKKGKKAKKAGKTKTGGEAYGPEDPVLISSATVLSVSISTAALFFV